MKSNSFVCATAIGLVIRQLFGWFLLIAANSVCWWRKFLDWHYVQQQQRRRRRQQKQQQYSKHTSLSPVGTMYEFRPFQLQVCDYKSYSKTKHRGRGINFTPKPRSGHRIAANETDLFSFGGKF